MESPPAIDWLLPLLLLSDSALPTGAFTTSSGWEAAGQHGSLQTRDDVAGWLGGMLDDQLAPIELPLMARAYRARTVRQADSVSRLLDRLIAVPGWSAASRSSGSRVLELCSLPPYSWHRAVALGWLAQLHEVPLIAALVAHGHAVLWAQAQVAIRLGLLAADEAVSDMRTLAPRISAAAESAAGGKIRAACAVSWEIAGAQQPLLPTRLFST